MHLALDHRTRAAAHACAGNTDRGSVAESKSATSRSWFHISCFLKTGLMHLDLMYVTRLSCMPPCMGSIGSVHSPPGRRVKTPHVGFHPPAPNWSFREERKPGQSHSKGFLRASGAAPGKLPDLHRQWRRPGTPGCADDGPAGC